MQITIDSQDLYVCTDCLYVLTFGPEHAAESSDPVKIVQGITGWERDGYELHPGNADHDVPYSTETCEICTCRLGGQRFHVQAVKHLTVTKVETG